MVSVGAITQDGALMMQLPELPLDELLEELLPDDEELDELEPPEELLEELELELELESSDPPPQPTSVAAPSAPNRLVSMALRRVIMAWRIILLISDMHLSLKLMKVWHGPMISADGSGTNCRLTATPDAF